MSKEMICSDYGAEIFEDDGRYTIRYDVGHLVSEFREDEMFKEEVDEAKRSQADAYQVLLRVMKRNCI